MEQISISEIQRNLHKLDNFDIIEVIDKKRDKVKGYFIEHKYFAFVKELSEQIQKDEKKVSLKGALNPYENASKIHLEKDAWKNHVLEKYSKDD
ncbi:MAG: hypothetical protein L3J43_06120 [Sulfurovum sp.]|nr:hypothetical protein [Sulfurovum sp.]